MKNLVNHKTNQELASIFNITTTQIETILFRRGIKRELGRGHCFKEIKWEEVSGGCFRCVSHKRMVRGYPKVKRKGKEILIVRVLYEQKYGLISKSSIIRHQCDNRFCINPDHVLPGTHKQNSFDMLSRNRCSNAILKTSDVSRIRELISQGSKNRDLAKMYNIDQSVISRIRHNKAWKGI